MYRCEATSINGFVRQLAVGYVAKGYWFYVRGYIKANKNPLEVDRRIVDDYGLNISKDQRYRRRANIQYLRYDRDFVIIATPGDCCDRFFIQEGRTGAIRNINRTPVKFHGYAISYRSGHAHVEIEQTRYLELKSKFLYMAVHRQAEAIEAEFRRIPLEPYGPVKLQLLNIWYQVNQARKKAGYKNKVSRSCLRERLPVLKRLVENPRYLSLDIQKAA